MCLLLGCYDFPAIISRSVHKELPKLFGLLNIALIFYIESMASKRRAGAKTVPEAEAGKPLSAVEAAEKKSGHVSSGTATPPAKKPKMEVKPKAKAVSVTKSLKDPRESIDRLALAHAAHAQFVAWDSCLNQAA